MTADNSVEFQRFRQEVETNGGNLRADWGIALAGLAATTGELFGPFRNGVPVQLTPETAVLAATIAVTFAAGIAGHLRMVRHGYLYRRWNESFISRSAQVGDMFTTMLIPPRFRKSA